MTKYISLLRPAQWLKNGFVLLPIFFSGKLLDTTVWLDVIPTVIAFCLISSAVYCLNDIIDIESDRKHPRKRKRPIASGAISKNMAKIILCVLVLASLSIVTLCYNSPHIRILLTSIILGYFILNIAYCYRLKKIAIIDVFVIAIGFVLRLFSGGTATQIWLSPWIVLMTFLLALFLAFAKRRDDVVMYEESGLITRGNIINYNLPFMNQTLGLLGAITIICYITYTVSPEVVNRLHNEYIYLTSVFVIAAILRYLQVSIVKTDSGSPTKILIHDRFIHFCIIGWVISFIVILYL